MKSLIILPLLALSLVACSSSRESTKKNEVCDKEWAPGTLDNTAAQEKTDTSENTKSISMNEGEYKTPGIRFFYYDKSADIRLDLNVNPGSVNKKTGGPNFSVNCVGGKGLRMNMEPLQVSIPYVSKMVVDGNGKSILSTNELTLNLAYKPGQSFISFAESSVSVDKNDSLKNTYPKDADTKHIFYKLSDDAYESRVQFIAQGRKDTKGDERSLDVRAYISYQKIVPPKDDKPTEDAK